MGFRWEAIGIPEDLAEDIGEFGKVSFAIETRTGNVFQGELGYPVGQDKTIPLVDLSEISSFHFDAIDVHYGELVKEVPLAWVNRLVLVSLAFGTVTGLLSDESLRDSRHLHLMPLPGRPPLAPIPVHHALGVALLPRAVHASLQHSPDGQFEVRKYLLQQGECMTVRELHVRADLSEDFKRLAISEEFGGFPVEEVSFHMLYSYAKHEQGYTRASFYRFPAPADGEAKEFAENDDWRLRWAVPNMHSLPRVPSADYFKTFDSDVELLREDVDDHSFPSNVDLCKICEAREYLDELGDHSLPAPLFDPMDLLRTREPTECYQSNSNTSFETFP